jgi:hypothetical protein
MWSTLTIWKVRLVTGPGHRVWCGVDTAAMMEFEIDIFSDPLATLFPTTRMWEVPDYSALSRYDAELVKPALLFADHVRLITFRETMRDMVYSRSATTYVMPMRRLANFVHLAIRRDPEELKSLQIDPAKLPSPEEARELWAAVGRREFSLWEKYADAVDDLDDRVQLIWGARYRDLEATELTLPMSSELLSVEGWLETLPRDHNALAINTDVMAQVAVESFVKMVTESSGRSMLDAGADWTLQSGRPRKRKPSRGRHGAWQASTMLAANAIVRIPGIDRLPIAELLDVKESLHDYLPAFRAEMIRLGDDVAAEGNASAEQIVNEVEHRYHRDIAPVVAEIRQQVAAAAFPRRLLNTMTSERDSLTALGGAVLLAAGSVATGLSTLVPAVAAATYPFAKAMAASMTGRDDVKRNRLYFLYVLERDFQRRV